MERPQGALWLERAPGWRSMSVPPSPSWIRYVLSMGQSSSTQRLSAQILSRPRSGRPRSRSLQASELPIASTQMAQFMSTIPPGPQTRERYRYAPLRAREIRRLRLLGADDRDEPLRGTIDTVPISTYITYTAVSYVWGDNSQPLQLLVGEDQYVPLTMSLDSQLRDFRELMSKSRKHADRWEFVIWVDQICINQDDDEEKGRQVKMMSEIYKLAKMVIIYTGPEKSEDRAALDFMTKFYDLWKSRNPERRQLSQSEWFDFLESFGNLPGDDEQIWDTIQNLLSGEWILRCWIFQEAILNDNTFIMRGAHMYLARILTSFGSLLAHEAELPLRRLLRDYSFSFYMEDQSPSPPLWMYVQQLRIILVTPGPRGNPEEASMFTLLRRALNLKSSLPRDKIYSLLGMAADVGSLGIVPDYSRPDAEVFTDLARRLLLKDQDLRVLEYVLDTPTSSSGSWPSWVPDWSYTGRSERRIFGEKCVYKTADSVRPSFRFSEDGKLFIVKGIIVDTITEALGVPCSGYFGKNGPIQSDPSIFLRCKEFLQVYFGAINAISGRPTLQLIEECKRFILVSTLGVDRKGQPVDLDKLRIPFWRWLTFVVSVVATPISMPDEGATMQKVVYWYSYFFIASSLANEYWTPLWLSFGRGMCATSHGRLCMGPGRSQKGDKIAVLLGGRVCYMLRPLPGADGQYEYLGDVYCEGLMRGEALADPMLTSQVCDLIMV